MLAEHSRDDRQDCGLCLPSRSRSDDHDVVTSQHYRDDFLLKRPEFSPTQTVDDVVLQAWMEEIKRWHKEPRLLQLNIVYTRRGSRMALGRREFRILDRQLVVLMGIKVRKLVDAVQDVGHQLL